MPTLGPALLQRFESRQGYRTFDDVEPCRKLTTSRLYSRAEMLIFSMLGRRRGTVRRLKELGIPTGLVSNADDRIRKPNSFANSSLKLISGSFAN